MAGRTAKPVLEIVVGAVRLVLTAARAPIWRAAEVPDETVAVPTPGSAPNPDV